MAVTTSSPMYVNFSETFSDTGITYNITGTTAEPVPTADGSTIFNIEIPTGYTFTEGSLVFKDATTPDPATVVTTTPTVSGQTLSFSIAQATTWTTGLCTIQFNLTAIV
jgi:hypothetical protein